MVLNISNLRSNDMNFEILLAKIEGSIIERYLIMNSQRSWFNSSLISDDDALGLFITEFVNWNRVRSNFGVDPNWFISVIKLNICVT